MRYLAFSILLLFSLSAMGRDKIPNAENGVLDLREHLDLVNEIALQGEWEFYWKQLISSEEFKSGVPVPDLYADIPSYWTQYKEAIPDVTGKGYGTYRLRILVPEGYKDTLALQIPIFDSSYDLLLNGRKISSNGIVGTTRDTSEPGYEPTVTYVYIQSDTLEIVIHVSNFFHRQGGFWKNISIGSYDYMHLKAERKKFAIHTSTGILLIFSLFFFIISLMDRRDKIMLYFALSVFGMFIRSMTTVYFPINYFFDLPWAWHIKIEYIGTYIGCGFGLLYLNRLFPSRIMEKITRYNTLLFGAMILVVLFFPVDIFAYTIYIFEVIIILLLSYYMIRSGIGVFRRKRIHTVFFFSFLLFLGAVVNDILISLSSTAVSYDYFTTIVFQLFILSQATLLIDQWLKDFREKTKLSQELEYINKNLEKIIGERTSEIKQKNLRLDAALQLKNKLFSIIAHDLKSPVASLAQYSDLLMADTKNPSDPEVLSNLNQLAYSTVDLIDNLLYWGMSQRKGIQYDPEQHDLSPVINDVLMLFVQNMANKKLVHELELEDNLSAWCDATLVKMILRNLLSNALKFSQPGGKILIKGVLVEGHAEITVVDEGVGMLEEKIRLIEKRRQVESSRGTEDEKGTGLGLLLVQELVEINRGTLRIQSKPGKGTAITFSLPGNHEI